MGPKDNGEGASSSSSTWLSSWISSLLNRLSMEDKEAATEPVEATSKPAAAAVAAPASVPVPTPAPEAPGTPAASAITAAPSTPAVAAAAAPAAASPQIPLRIPSADVHGIAKLIQEGKAKNIICMCGAGISVSAGIPDFRTPGSGLFSNMGKYNISRPEDVFHIDFFEENPEPFHLLASELFPGQFRPTPTHFLMRLLHDKGLLLRCFTQNIDSLETQAGLPQSAVVAAHGNFDTASCIACKRPYPISFFKDALDSQQICRCSKCNSLVKPDIVFYGENLPARFFRSLTEDFPKCDLLIVMGTSLVVYPFASLINHVTSSTPRLLINRELVGNFDLSPGTNRRDAVFLGDCDDGAHQLAALLGWQEELEALSTGHSRSP